jgi:molybdenum cofactor synthesis domain-containing protein
MELKQIEVISVNISEAKGTVKHPVESIQIYKEGVKGDAHSGPWNRMVSLLGKESVRRFEQQAGRIIQPGEFAENITTEGLELTHTRPLDRFIFQEVLLEVTQLGKKCHGDHCAIFREVGNCVMPKEGIFCRVLKPGTIKAGDIARFEPKVFRCLVITMSDRASHGVYEDKSGPALERRLTDYFETQGRCSMVQRIVIPDDAAMLKELLQKHQQDMDFIFTTGGTGIGPRDITPEVVRPLLDKEIPGIMEMIRVKYGMEKPNALLSRGVAGLMDGCFVFTLPGSVKAVDEYMDEITKGMMHLVFMLHGLDMH